MTESNEVLSVEDGILGEDGNIGLLVLPVTVKDFAEAAMVVLRDAWYL